MNIIRKKTYSVDEVLKHVKQFAPGVITTMDFDGDVIKLGGSKMLTFKFKGTKCAGNCGLKGTFFAKERDANVTDRWHFNLYGVDKDGNEVLFTRDHIIPQSKGGGHFLDNLQPMCIVCNSKKGAFLPNISVIKKVQKHRPTVIIKHSDLDKSWMDRLISMETRIKEQEGRIKILEEQIKVKPRFNVLTFFKKLNIWPLR